MLRITLLSFSLLLVSMVSGAVDALAQTTVKQKQQECVSLIKERTAAIVTRDWKQLEKIAKRYIQTCKSVHDSESIANAHMDLANAYSGLGNQSSALAATEACIDLFYASPSCHVYRVEFLLKLERRQDARAALTIAEKLVGYLIPTTEKDLQRTIDSDQSELNTAMRTLYTAKLEQLRGLEDHIDWLRPQMNQ